MEITFEAVRDVIVDTLSCEAEEIKLETNLFEDMKIDSLEAVELSMALQEAFGEVIHDLPNVKTVQQIMDYLTSHK